MNTPFSPVTPKPQNPLKYFKLNDYFIIFQYIVFFNINEGFSMSSVLSYSSFLIVISEKVLNEAIIDAPIHAAYFLCRSAYTLISVLALFIAKLFISYSNLSVKPGKREVPPANTMLLYRFIFRSGSHFSIELKAI